MHWVWTLDALLHCLYYLDSIKHSYKKKKKKIWSSPEPTRTIQYKLTTEMAVLVKDITYCYPFFPDSVKVIVWVFILVLLNPRKLYEFSD